MSQSLFAKFPSRCFRLHIGRDIFNMALQQCSCPDFILEMATNAANRIIMVTTVLECYTKILMFSESVFFFNANR